MPYDKNDPRSQLSTAGSAPTGIPRPAQYRELHKIGPDEKLRLYIGCGEGWTFYLANLKSMLEGGIDLRNKNDKIKGVINS